MNRLLSLDGGGIRAILTLEILDRMESLLRERSGNPRLVLADYFNFIGGTSTGAIVAAGLSWGMDIASIRSFYRQFAERTFRRIWSFRMIRHHYDSKSIAATLQRVFAEEDGRPAQLGSDRLRTLLLLVMRNGSSGSVWPVTNSPAAKYNDRQHDSCNLDYPLWQLIRASTAAPTYFPTETIRVKRRNGKDILQEFIDGGVSPYNNPTLRMFAQATVPEMGIGMAAGTERMLIVSVGTGRVERIYEYGKLGNINMLGGAIRTINAILDSSLVEQDVLCRLFGRCIHGEKLDSELGDLIRDAPGKQFLYCRYNHTFTDDEKREAREVARSRNPFDLADLKSVPLLERIGKEYAREHVSADHLPDWGQGLGRRILRPDGTVGDPQRLIAEARA